MVKDEHHTPILLINLDRSTDRLERARSQLSALELNFERISAVDGSKLDKEVVSHRLEKDFSAYYKKLSKTELACYLSHRKCWQKIVDENIKHAIILEDDFNLKKEFGDLQKHLAKIPVEWDCIKLSEYPIKRKEEHLLRFEKWKLLVYNKVPSRTGAYAISHSGAKKMLASSDKIGRPVDIDFQYWWEKDLYIFGLKPYPVALDENFSSTIDAPKSSRKKANKSVKKQILQKLIFTIQNRIKTKSRVREMASKYPELRINK